MGFSSSLIFQGRIRSLYFGLTKPEPASFRKADRTGSNKSVRLHRKLHPRSWVPERTDLRLKTEFSGYMSYTTIQQEPMKSTRSVNCFRTVSDGFVPRSQIITRTFYARLFISMRTILSREAPDSSPRAVIVCRKGKAIPRPDINHASSPFLGSEYSKPKSPSKPNSKEKSEEPRTKWSPRRKSFPSAQRRKDGVLTAHFTRGASQSLLRSSKASSRVIIMNSPLVSLAGPCSLNLTIKANSKAETVLRVLPHFVASSLLFLLATA